MSLTVHIDLPTDHPAEAWHVAALIATTAEEHFELEVDDSDLAVTDSADWSQHVDDDSDAWRPIEDVPDTFGVLS